MRLPRQLTVLLAAGALAGCAGNAPSLSSLTSGLSYQASNAIAPNGYAESILGPDQYRVRATGFVENTRAELEKLAMVRAADIGSSQNLKFFRVVQVTEDIICGKKLAANQKVTETKIRPRRVVDIDVTYAKEPTDPTWLNSKDSFAALKAELDAMGSTAPAGGEAGRAEAEQRCGKL